MNEKAFRENLVELLRGASAHITPEDALKGVNLKMCTVRPDGMPHSMWDLFEHMRITQHDILHYMLDPAWKSPAWPEGYWPGRKEHLTQKEWSGSITAFTSDLNELIAFVNKPGQDLVAQIPHGEGRTYLREILLAADHTAYHLGQFVLVRKALDNWEG